MSENYKYAESHLEDALLELLEELGWEYLPGGKTERTDRREVILEEKLRDAVYRLNPMMPDHVKEDALKQVMRLPETTLIKSNEQFHKMLVEGVNVGEYIDKKNKKHSGGKVYLVDFENIDSNEFIAVNQLKVEGKDLRIPDVVLYVNGLPLVLIELKSLSNENVGIQEAYTQVNNYKSIIPKIFVYNSFCVISDGVNAKAGTISSNEERFMTFRTIDGIEIAPTSAMMMEVLTRGMLSRERILEITKDFLLFLNESPDKIKILAQYHQMFAVKKALEKTEIAIANEGKIGVVWHTQGSGKSLTMVFYAGQLMKKFNNPTIVVLTDRNDLDNQLFETFSKCTGYLVETPKQAENKENLRNMLNVGSGGIIFTTIQKFSPQESEDLEPVSLRKDIYIIADEAHRSQYGLDAKMDEFGNSKYGYAKYVRDALPNANYIGFTGTPIDFDDKSTVAVFGDYIDIYDMTRAVEDGATVKIYYENRFIKLDLNKDLIDKIDDEFKDIMSQQEERIVESKKRDITKMEAIIGAKNRIKTLAEDLVAHWEMRRKNAYGKCMIVCMSRKICVDLYNEIVKIRPEWHSDDKKKGKIKVVMTSNIAKDPEEFKPHFTTKEDREELANRMKDDNDELEMVIVRDMWLTGFDVPCLNTMYIDKPMIGHNLMQAIARVNRVYKDKSGGLVVDYIGIGDDLKRALKQYSNNDRKTTGINQEEAVAIMLEYYEKVKELFHGFDYSDYKDESSLKRGQIIIAGMDFILNKDNQEKNYKNEFIDNVLALSKAHALCVTTKEGIGLNCEIAYFKAVRASLMKLENRPTIGPNGKILTEKEINDRLAKLMAKTIISEEVVDVYGELGIKNPDLSIFSEEFLEDLSRIKYKNLAVEMLKKLLEGKIKSFGKRNIVASEKLSEKLKKAISRYKNKEFTSFEMMELLKEMARDVNEEVNKGKKLGLSDEEMAFYDILTKDESIFEEINDKTMIEIVKDLTDMIKRSVSIDWYDKESVKAKIKNSVRRLLSKYKYPPKKTRSAVDLIVSQAKDLDFDIRPDIDYAYDQSGFMMAAEKYSN